MSNSSKLSSIEKLRAYTESNNEKITNIPFFVYWILIIFQDTYNKNESEFIKEFINFLLLLIPQKAAQKIIEAFNDMNTISNFFGINYAKLKKNILISIFNKWNIEEIDNQILSSLFSLCFSTLFIRNHNMKCNSVYIKNPIFDLESIDKSEKKNWVFCLNTSNNSWDDNDLAEAFKDCSKPMILSKIVLRFSDDVSINAQLAYAYIVGMQLKLGIKKSDALNEVVDLVEKLDGDVEHVFVGIILQSMGIKSTKFDCDDKNVQFLIDRFNLMDDNLDSPAFQMFEFEDYICSNCSSFAVIPT